jgi:hypothetical protein
MSMQSELQTLLAEMGEFLEARDLGPVDLYLLGGCVLVLYDDRLGATKDLDAVEERLTGSDAEAAAILTETFGKASGREPYLDPVKGGLPPLPFGWKAHAVCRPSPSTSIRLWSLGFADLIVSKLRRWHPRDRADIRHVCDRHPEVRERLAAVSEGDFFAVDWWEEMEPRRDRVLDYLDGQIDEL